MKGLVEKRRLDPKAAQAVEMFCYQIRKFVGAFAATLDGLDTLVFTGGSGERAAAGGAEVCCGLAHLGLELGAGEKGGHCGGNNSAQGRVPGPVGEEEGRL